MYEYYNYGEQKETTPATMEQILARQKAEKKAARKKRTGKIFLALGLGLAFGVMAGGGFLGVKWIADRFFPKAVVEAVVEEPKEDAQSAKEEAPEIKSTPTAPAFAPQLRTEGTYSVSDVAVNCMPAIVSITNKSVQEIRSMFGMGVQQYESESCGSGIIVGESDTELLIVTNNHVSENANTLSVCFIDNEVYEAYVKGADSDVDLAIVGVNLKDIKQSTLDAISVAVMGDSGELVVGEQVVAIGNALGYGQSVTTGIVSALDREVTIEKITNKLIQTDAAINPGNSGGALLNMKGELIGINSAKFASAQVEGMGYAIPISTATPIIEDLMNRETRDKVEKKDAGYLGISGVTVTQDASKNYGLPEGVYLREISEDSPAEKCGLQVGDVIRKFDGVTVKSITELQEQLDYYKADEQVEVLFYRSENGEYVEKTVTVTLGSRKGTPLDPDLQQKQEKDSVENGSDNGNNGRDYYDGNNGYYFFNPFDFFGF